MTLAFVLLKMTNLQLGVILMIVALIILAFSVAIVRFIQSKKKNSQPKELHAEAEITERLDTVDHQQPVVEEKVPITPADEYRVDESDSNLFINSLYKDFTIRTTLGIHLVKSKDTMIFTTSFPWEVEEKEHQGNRFKKSFLAAVPQLTKIESGGTHEVILHKSSACKWEDLKDGILKFMFYHLHKMYAWKFEKQIVCISEVPNEQIRSFDLRIETKYHLDLGRRLLGLKGIVDDNVSDGFPICMDHDGHYDFSLQKACAYTWEELLPEIEKVITEYFTAGVEFRNITSKYSSRDFSIAGSFNDHNDF